MKRVAMSVVAAATLCAGSALGADLRPIVKAPPPVVTTSPWDIAFGGSFMSDYNFRGISQSDRGPSVSAYVETQFNANENFQLYLATAGTSVKLPSDPTAEFDYYGGIRPKIGIFTFDFGAMYYHYPKEYNLVTGVKTDTDFWEVYGKVAIAVTSNFTITGGVYHGIDWLQTGADGTYFVGGAKLAAPTLLPNGIGGYVSGEFGHYSFSTPDAGFFVFDYNYWNVGLGFTWKVFTLDLRYHDTDLSQDECDLMAGSGGRKWCGQAFIVKLSLDSALSQLK